MTEEQADRVHDDLRDIRTDLAQLAGKVEQHLGEDRVQWATVAEAARETRAAQIRIEAALAVLMRRADEHSDEGAADPVPLAPPSDADRVAAAPRGGLEEDTTTGVDLRVRVGAWPTDTRAFLRYAAVLGLGIGILLGAAGIGVRMAGPWISAALAPAAEVVGAAPPHHVTPTDAPE